MKRLSECVVGERVTIIKIENCSYIKLLLSLGFIVGKEIEVVRFAPLKDPIEVIINNCHYALGTKEASTIICE